MTEQHILLSLVEMHLKIWRVMLVRASRIGARWAAEMSPFYNSEEFSSNTGEKISPPQHPPPTPTPISFQIQTQVVEYVAEARGRRLALTR